MIIQEGKVRIFAPNVNTRGPGKIEGVFYNREMVFNRDTSIFLLHNMKVRNALDGLAATGVRGIRFAKELGKDVTISDKSPEAVKVIRKNAEMNGVDVRIENENVNALMAREKFEYIDIDPFGTPVPFIDMALQSGKILGITATDTATLGGRNRRVERRYLATVKSPAPLVHEIGIRVLLGYIARMAVRFDLGIEPVFSVWRGHFYRVYVRIHRGVSWAKRTLENVGNCQYGGPLWMGELHDHDFLKNAKIPEWLPTGELLEKYLGIWKEERGFLFYHIPTISRELHISSPSPRKLVEGLKSMGYYATRTQFSPQGVRTDAPKETIRKIMLGEVHK